MVGWRSYMGEEWSASRHVGLRNVCVCMWVPDGLAMLIYGMYTPMRGFPQNAQRRNRIVICTNELKHCCTVQNELCWFASSMRRLIKRLDVYLHDVLYMDMYIWFQLTECAISMARNFILLMRITSETLHASIYGCSQFCSWYGVYGGECFASSSTNSRTTNMIQITHNSPWKD